MKDNRYNYMSPQADKLLQPDGSITTMAGVVVSPPSQSRAEMYNSMSPMAAKWLLPDGTIVSELPTMGGGSGGEVSKLYVDTRDAATLTSAKNYADGLLKGGSDGTLHYMYENTFGIPTGNEIRFNPTTLRLANKPADTNGDAHTVLMLLNNGTRIYIQELGNHANYIRGLITGDPLDKGTYVEYPFSIIETVGMIPENKVAFAFASSGQIVTQAYVDNQDSVTAQQANLYTDTELAKEVLVRQAVNTTLMNSISSEKTDRETADTNIQTQIDGLRGAWVTIGRNNFGTLVPEQIDLTNFATSKGLSVLRQGITVINTYNDSNDEWQWVEELSKWINFGQGEIPTATNSVAGLVKGSIDPLMISVGLNGLMSVNGLDTELLNRPKLIKVADEATAIAQSALNPNDLYWW